MRRIAMAIIDQLPEFVCTRIGNLTIVWNQRIVSITDIVRAVVPFSHIGTLEVYTTLQELQQIAPSLFIDDSN